MLNYPKKNKLGLNTKFIPRKDNRSYKPSFILKRIADVLVSIALLLILSLPLILVMILIKLDSSGSIFFTQNRIGLNHKPFRVFKFRTMIQNAPHMQTHLEHRNEIEGGVLFKIKADPRITRIGKFLRRYSIDEIPQLINVLQGDMSLVGPRPLTIRDALKLSSNQYHRYCVLPGITGLWQVKGRSESNSKQLHVYDDFYVHRWSLKLDFVILLQTILVVVKGKGAC